MASLVTDMSKKVIVIAVAGSMSLFGANLQELVTQDMDRAINHLINGEVDTTTSSAIDKNLAYMQVAFTAIDAVEVVGDNPELRAEKSRALLFAGFGTSSPALTAGAMLIFFKFSLGFFIGLGPIFILMLLFKGTQPMFQRWLQYGIATLFAMAGLNAVTSIILDLSARVAVAFWAAKGLNGILMIDPEGMTLQAMQQGGIGILLTTAIVSVPTGLAAFFGGLAGNFMHFSAFGGGAGSMPGPQGQPPGSYAPPSTPPPTNAAPPQEGGTRAFGDPTHGSRVMGSSAPQSPDVISKKSNT
jgi:type IV secretion system protein VirB6